VPHGVPQGRAGGGATARRLTRNRGRQRSTDAGGIICGCRADIYRRNFVFVVSIVS
jgi:hypothetical protein